MNVSCDGKVHRTFPRAEKDGSLQMQFRDTAGSRLGVGRPGRPEMYEVRAQSAYKKGELENEKNIVSRWRNTEVDLARKKN
jgi:hypothetical protein